MRSADDACQEAAAGCIANIASNALNYQWVDFEECITPLIYLLSHSRSRVKEQAANALRNIAADDKYEQLIVQVWVYLL